MTFLTALRGAAARPTSLAQAMARPRPRALAGPSTASVRAFSACAPAHGTARRLVYERPAARVPEPKQGITTPVEFIQAITRLPRRDLAGDAALVEALPEDWAAFFSLTGAELEEKGLTTANRKYVLWAMERFRQGYDVRRIAYQPKSKKLVRYHGGRVQNGYRVRGIVRPNEKAPPRNRRNMKRPY